MSAKQADPRTIAFALCGAALPILIGTLSSSWVTGPHGSAIGPTGPEVCLGTFCRGVPWGDGLLGAELLAIVALVAGLAAVAACVGFGGLYLAGRTAKLPKTVHARRIFAAAVVCFVGFEARLLALDGMSLSWAPFFATAGVVAGFVLLRKLAPHLLPAPPVAPIMKTLPTGEHVRPATCPKCGTIMTFDSAKQKWFCLRDQEYVE